MKTFLVLALSLLFCSQISWAGSYALKVTEKGFEPASLAVKAGENVTLKITRLTDITCATQIVVPSKKLKADLPLNKEVTLALGKLPKGEVKFACGMAMVGGVILAQ